MLVNGITGTINQPREELPSVIEPEGQVQLQAHTVKSSLWHKATWTWADPLITDCSKQNPEVI